MDAKIVGEVKFLTLSDGTRAVARPIGTGDGPCLQRGLARLSPESNAYRFLHFRGQFTEEDLRYLTGCDFVDHIGVILALLDGDGSEIDQVGVARCIRDRRDAALAEVAIVLVDEWQGKRGGSALLKYLAMLAWRRGIRRWQAFSFVDNVAARHLLSTVGTEISQRRFGHGIIESIYELNRV